MRSWLSVLITDAESKKVFDIPIAPSLYSLSNKMDNSLLAVRDINHKYIVVESKTNALKTGDHAPVIGTGIGMVLALSAIIVILKYRRSKNTITNTK